MVRNSVESATVSAAFTVVWGLKAAAKHTAALQTPAGL